MRDVSKKLSVVLAGYYEDFHSSRVIAEGEDYSTATDLLTNRRNSHAGNTMAAMAYNNPRFTFDYLHREGFYPLSPTLTGLATFSGITATLHNEGPSQWLTTDPNRLSFLHWEGRSQLTYPDTIGDAASIKTEKQPRRADYSLLASGWGTQNRMWVQQGDTDATYGHSRLTTSASAADPYGAGNSRGYAKYEKSAADTGSPQNGFDFSKVAHSSNLAGVVMGEQTEESASGRPYMHLHPIKSPSGKPFFVHRHSRRVTDWAEFTAIGNSSGNKQYVLAASAFDDEGSVASDDKWFFFRSKSTTVSASSISSGQTLVTVATSETPLDPSDDRTLPDKTGTAAHSITIGGDAYTYTSVNVVGGNATFTLASATTTSYTTPSVTFNSTDYGVLTTDTTLVCYNINTTSLPNLEDVLPVVPDSTDTSKQNIFLKEGSVITDHGLVHTNTSYTTTSSSTKGYSIYQVTLNVIPDSNFTIDPDRNLTGGPYLRMFPRGGRLKAGDYIMVRDQTAPEKVTAVSGANITTDATYSATGTGHLRLATYGSYDEGEGRPLDGMHGFQTVMVGDAALNATANGEKFTIRMAVQSFDQLDGTNTGPVDMVYRLAVGYDQTEANFELNERGNMTGSKAAITHDFRLDDATGLAGSKTRLFKMFSYGAGSKTTYTADQLWFDLDIVVNFDTQQYWVFDDGTNVGGPQAFNAKPGGGSWSGSDFYGWSLGVNIVDGYSSAVPADDEKWATAITMIDRVAWCFPLSDRLSHATIPADMPTDDFIVSSLRHKSQVDSISTLELKISDDENNMNLPQLYTGRPDWRVLVYRDSDYRPIFSSLISAVEFTQSAKRKTKEIDIKGRDALGEMDFTFPYFDVGQYEAMPSAVAGYRHYEVEAYSRAFHLGAVSLLTLNQFIGLDKFSVGTRGEYLPRYDQRMRLYSGHPIQVYTNEETLGPNNVEDAWEVSRVISHFQKDPVDVTKTLVVLRDDNLPFADDMLPHNTKMVIKGMWSNVGSTGTYPSTKTLPEDVERGYITLGVGNQTNTSHNRYRGEHTVEQRETVTTATEASGDTTIVVADTSLFPSSGTLNIELSGTHTYTGKTGVTFTGLSPGLRSDIAPGTRVREQTLSDTGVIIDVPYRRSLFLRKIEDAGGKLKMTLEQDVNWSQPYEANDLDTTNTSGKGDSAVAKNPLILTESGNDEKFRVYVEVNSAGSSAGIGDLPSQVYESSAIESNSYASNKRIVITTTTNIADLPSSVQTALTSGGGAVGDLTTDYGDCMEADLAYLSFPKITLPNIYNVNVGNGYVYRDSHARWIRDLPQSLWFQKTFGIIRKDPYDNGSGLEAKTTLASSFDTTSASSIALTDVTYFPYAGVCEIWSHDPDANTDEPAEMLTSFAYSGKDIANNELDNVMFADTTKGTISTTAPGSLGSRYVLARNISGDYKHMFVLWADMRNDGSADADGGTRKEDFGLIYPVAQNYKVSVVWAETGQRFADLKVGQDCEIWAISAENDPAGSAVAGSTKTWSEYPTSTLIEYGNGQERLAARRSNDTELHTHLKNWEDKAGAFILVDLSKFFNLNTESNNGRINQSSGGSKPLGQLLVDQAGTPTLIDSYWYHAAANRLNSADPIPEHINQNRWVDASTTLTQDVLASNPTGSLGSEATSSSTFLDVTDHTQFPPSSTLGLLGGSDTFSYTGKAGKISSLSILSDRFGDNKINAGVASGTISFTGGSGSGFAATYDRQYGTVTGDRNNNHLTITSGGTGYGANNTGTWTCDQDSAYAGTWESNASGNITALTFPVGRIIRGLTSDVLTFTINGSGAGAALSHDTSVVYTIPGNIAITNAGSGYKASDPPTSVVLSTSTSGPAGVRGITWDIGYATNQLTGVTGVGTTHPIGTSVTFSGTMDTMHVVSTADFPATMGVSGFMSENTSAKIEAVTTDANGNEAKFEYVFSYTGKTSTTFTGVKFRPIRQGETADVASAGLWANDTFTVSGLPAMLKNGTVIRGSLGSSFPMGFMLSIDGFIKSPNSGSFFEHDKIRIMQTSALFSDWFKQVNVPALSDISNVPIMHDFNVTGAVDGTGTIEDFGSVLDARNKSYYSVLRTLATSAGVGSSSSLLTFNFQMGRDNRLEFRPTYNAGHALNRNKLKISSLKSGKSATFTHVRVLYNGGLSSVDHPQLTYKGNHRFRFVDAVDVTSYEQALAIAKMEYQKRKDAAFSVEAEVIRESNETQRDGPMLANARYGYIADPARQSVGPYGGYWSALRGGSPFPGQVSAMHGSISGYGLLDPADYGSVRALGIGIGGYAGADDFTTTYGMSLAYYPTNYVFQMYPWEMFYYWYGAASVSYAVQIVHVPKGMPKVGESSGEELRIFISDEVDSIPATDRLTDDVSKKRFGIHFVDYTFDETYSGSNAPELDATQNGSTGISSISVKGNGYFEVPIPASYWPAGNAAGYKMVISVNADYLSALARHKCGDKFGGNAITTPVGAGAGKPTFTNSNEFSIFPLGIRTYPEMGDFADSRSIWYAPRLHVVDDVNYLPGTYASYVDDRLGINETLYILSVDYEYTPDKLDRTKLRLERDLGRMPLGIEGYLATNPFNDTGGQGPPAGGGGGSSGSPTSGRDGGGPYRLPPGGYDGGQAGIGPGRSYPPLVGMESGDLGGVGGPNLDGVNRQRLNRDTGVQQDGQFNDQSLVETNINNLSESSLSRLTGSLNLDNLLPGAVLSIPGQPAPTIIAPKQRAMEGVDTKFVSSQGQATETEDGWMLPGASQLDDGEAVTNIAHGVKMQATMPKDVAHPVVGIEAFISCDLGPASSKTISLTTTMTCPDTGESISHTYEETIASSITRKAVQLLPTQLFNPATVEGRNMTVEIVRKPNQGNDNANFSAVIINGIQVTNTVHNNQGRTQSSDVSAFSGDALNTTSLTLNSVNPLDDTNPLS